MQQSGYIYTSANSKTAKKNVTIKVNIGIGRLGINWK
jgi:alanine racemase